MTQPASDPSTAHRPAPGDWLDALLAAEADGTAPADAGFSDAVLRALPAPAARAAVAPRLGVPAVTLLAMAVAAGMLAWTIPDALDLLVAGEAALRAMAPTDMLRRALPAIAVLAWLGWASLHHALDD